VAPLGYWSIVLGAVLVALGAALALGAEGQPVSIAFWAGVVLLLGGSTLILSGVTAVSRTSYVPSSLPAWWRHSQAGDVREVLTLGEIAVQHAGFVTEEQLAAALEVHREERRPLGGVMVSMGLITAEQLAELMTVQQWHADHWGAGR